MQTNRIPFILPLILLLTTFLQGHAQELLAEITVSTPKLQTTDPAVFKTLEKDLKDFLNQERWTNDEYKPYERISCNFSVNITGELGNNSFSADIALKAIRPVYGSEYSTVLINHVDRDIIFNYQEFPLREWIGIFRDNLSAVFPFTPSCFGFGWRKFSSSGGDEYFGQHRQS